MTSWYFHGGGLMCGNPEGVRSTAARIARAAHATVLVPDYRLAPEHAYPAALAGIVIGSVWNYALSSRFVWGRFG